MTYITCTKSSQVKRARKVITELIENDPELAGEQFVIGVDENGRRVVEMADGKKAKNVFEAIFC